MRTRWEVNDDWIVIGCMWLAFGWIPLSLLGNWLTGGNSQHMTWGSFAGMGIVWGPPSAWLAFHLLRWLASVGAPIHRVTEPVTDDLRERTSV